MNNILENYKLYYSKGLRAIPLNGKAPIIKDWASLAITEDMMMEWAERYPNSNIGIVCGARSNIVVVDFDAQDAVRLLYENTRINLDIVTPTVITKKGMHKYFRYPDSGSGLVIKNKARLEINGFKYPIDIRGEGGQVVAPPSIHPDDEHFVYQWKEGMGIDQVEIADLPQEIIQYIKESKSMPPVHKTPAIVPSVNNEKIEVGQRNDRLFKLACSYRCKRIDMDECLTLVQKVNQCQCDPLLDENEVVQIVNSAYNYNVRNYDLNDTGLAERMNSRYPGIIHYCDENNKWYIWNQSRWVIDNKREIERMARLVISDIKDEASNLPDDNEHKKVLASYARKSGDSDKIQSMLKCLKASPGITIELEKFDSDPLLINCLNGVIDLKTGVLIKPNPEMMQSKQVRVKYDPEARCPLWLEFLKLITEGRQELIDYLQQIIGYSTTGKTNEESFFFLYGNGCNGKSTFINIIMDILGDYAQSMPSRSLMLNKNDNSISNDLARMMKARLVVTNELPEGRSLNEETIKLLTSQDPIVCRYLYREYFQFDPTHTLIIIGNHKPKIIGQDYGIWRRVKLVPFNILIPKEKQDKNFGKKLAEEKEGIFRWMVEGAVKWYRSEGLSEPEAVKESIIEYKQDMDVIGEFLDENCSESQNAQCLASDLFIAYNKYCENAMIKPLGKIDFNRKVEEKGFIKKRKSQNKVCFCGITIKGPSKDYSTIALSPVRRNEEYDRNNKPSVSLIDEDKNNE